MHLSLQVPDDFCLDKWFETALPEDVALGLNAIPQLIQFVNSKNHNDHLQIKELDELKCKNQQDKIRELEEENHKLASETARLRSDQEYTCKVDQSTLIAEKVISRLEPKLPIVETTKSSPQIGRNGEDFVIQGLSESHIFSNWLIEDTRKKEGCMDIFLSDCNSILDDFNCRIGIEVKSGDTYLKNTQDIEKFERDCSDAFKSGRCNAALFLNMRPHNIPRRGKCCVEIMDNCPVIYLTNKDMEVVSTTLIILRTMAKFCHFKSSVHKSDEEMILETYLPGICNFVFDQRQRLEANKKALETLQKSFDQESKQMYDSISAYETLTTKLPYMRDFNSKQSQEVINWMFTYVNRKKKFPRKQDMPVWAKDIVKKCGYNFDELIQKAEASQEKKRKML